MTPVQKLVQRFTALYGPPDTHDRKAFVAEYERALGKASDSQLSAASDLLVREHKFKSWPTVGECVAALRKVSFERERTAEFDNYGALTSEPRRRPTDAERVRVAAMVASCIANLAAEAGETRSQQPGFAGIDREAWIMRQTSLVAAGKWCLSNASSSRRPT